MASKLSQIKESIQAIAQGGGVRSAHNSTIHIGKVLSTTGDTCEVDIDGLIVTDVRVNAIVDSDANQLFIKPVVDSYVLMVDISGGSMTDLAIISYTKIESIDIATKDEPCKITLNGGDNGELINIAELTDKLNSLVDEVNAFKDIYNAHTHSLSVTVTSAMEGPISGTGTGAATTSQASAVTPLNADDYKDTNITH